jgi:membrane-bound ClpP family serine protease
MRDRSTTAWSFSALLLAAVSIPLATACRAASISVDSYIFGGTRISFRGDIVPGDERWFRAAADRAADDDVVVVALASPGGVVDPAIAIGRMVRERGFMTMVWSSAGCASACALIWLAGQPAVIQRGAFLGFHAPAYENGEYSPDGAAIVARYLHEIGLTRAQIDFALATPQPAIHRATVGDALRLGVIPMPMPSLFGTWRACPARICLAVP